MIKKTVIFLSVLLLLTAPIKAESLYSEMYGALPETEDFEGNEILEKYGLDLKDENWIKNLNLTNIFSIFKELVVNGYKAPLSAFLSVLSAVIIAAAFAPFLKENEHFLSFLVIAAAAFVLLPLFNSLTVAGQALKTVANFMLSFIPIFIGVVISSGLVGVGTTSSPLLLFVATTVSKISTDTFLPLMGGYLSLSITGSISPAFSLNSLASSIKGAANFIMGLCTTIFLGVLSISGNVSAAGDSLAMKTTRFLVSGVPVVGGAIAESIGATTAATELLKTGVGAFGMVAVAIILLPVLVNLLLWKASLMLSSFAAEILDIKSLSDFLKSVTAVISVTIGIIIFVGILFIIGLAIIVGLRK